MYDAGLVQGSPVAIPVKVPIWTLASVFGVLIGFNRVLIGFNRVLIGFNMFLIGFNMVLIGFNRFLIGF